MIASPPTGQPSIVDQAIAVLKDGDKVRGAELLAQVIQRDPNNELAWLWLSAIVGTAAERRFCLERVQAINPQNAAVQRGLQTLPAGTQPPAMARDGRAKRCTFPGCHTTITNAGHTYCYGHWIAVYRPPARIPSATVQAEPIPQLFSASTLAERLALHDYNVNLMLAEIGWISKEPQGWKATDQGSALGAVQKFDTQTGTAYVLWPETMLTNTQLLATIRALKGTSEPAPKSDSGFRKKFPAKHRTTDGHLVRSKAEVLIDNWLYMMGIVHAYERRLPIEEEVYCDFYVPAGKVYIEYWGLENDPKYLARKQAKQELYRKYQLNLIELNDDHIRNVDDELPKLLLKFGVVVS